MFGAYFEGTAHRIYWCLGYEVWGEKNDQIQKQIFVLSLWNFSMVRKPHFFLTNHFSSRYAVGNNEYVNLS